MSVPNSPEDYWLRNELNGIVASIPLEPDCDTVSQQLCRDLYFDSKFVPFDLLGARSIQLHLFSSDIDAVQQEATPSSELTVLKVLPVGWSSAGALLRIDNAINKHGEPEHLLVGGGVFSVNPNIHFSGEHNVIEDENWFGVPKDGLAEYDVKGVPMLLARGGLPLGSHLAYWQTYSIQGVLEYVRETSYFDVSDFTRVKLPNEETELYITHYLTVSETVLVGADVETEKGEIISLQM